MNHATTSRPSLATQHPTPAAAAVSAVQLEQELTYPKQTELFVSDIHGEYESFAHILRNGCGTLRSLIQRTLPTLPEDDQAQLVTTVCYPHEVYARRESNPDLAIWYGETLHAACALLKELANEHTADQLTAALTSDSAPLVYDLLMRIPNSSSVLTTNSIMHLINTQTAGELLACVCHAIQRLLVDKLHMVGDVYDRGPAPELIMDELAAFPHLDIQWGNHDIVWMGAALGQRGCIAHVVRNCARYGNLSILSQAYGIDLSALEAFALEAYRDDPCVGYALKEDPGLSEEERVLNVKIQKAMAILQFKVEGQLIDENPSFELEDRKLLHRIDRQTNTVEVDGIRYELTDPLFPTVDFANPYQLTNAEEHTMQALEQAFRNCEKLQRHMQLFLEKGSLYHIENNLLLFHACVPLNEDGTLKEVNLFGSTFKGKALFDEVDRWVRAAFNATDPAERKQGCDLLWYLWLGQGSPLFAKSKMATFEIYLIADKAARKEVKNPFYSLLDNPEVTEAIFCDFGLDPQNARIICGHTPVKVKDGEDPIKGKGRVIIIDGGFSSAYQKTTGIAGLTLISDRTGLRLASHEPFAGREAAISHNQDVHSHMRTIEKAPTPLRVADSDRGVAIRHDLKELARG